MAPVISALILNYGAPTDELQRCVDSVLASTGLDGDGRARLQEVVIVDNSSPHNREAPAEVARRANAVSAQRAGRAGVPVRVVQLGRNWGFAGGINRGLATIHPTTDWVFLLNNDAWVESECLAQAARAAAVQPSACVAVAPKMLLANHPHHLDAVGNCINDRGEAWNIGIGQLDVGQYDRTERSFGPCFGAALIRRTAFEPDRVGPLDESLFLYYEDVDWNWRATLRGLHSVTAPLARVHHTLSGSTRHLDYSFKFRLQERNLLLVCAKNFTTRRAMSIWRRRSAGHFRGALTGHFPLASLQASAGAWARIPFLVKDRRAAQAGRVCSDEDVVRFSAGERPFIDTVTYEPERSLAALGHAYRRRAALIGDGDALAIAEMCSALESTALRSLTEDLMSERLLPLLEREPEYVREYVRSLSKDRPPHSS